MEVRTVQDRPKKGLNAYWTGGGASYKVNQSEGGTGANGHNGSSQGAGSTFRTRGMNAAVTVTAYGRDPKALVGMQDQ